MCLPFPFPPFYAGVEADFMQQAARERWPVLMAVFCFDLASYSLRVAAKGVAGGFAAVPVTLLALYPQLLNMAVLYMVIHFINRRSRRATGLMWAAVQVQSTIHLCRAGCACCIGFQCQAERHCILDHA